MVDAKNACMSVGVWILRCWLASLGSWHGLVLPRLSLNQNCLLAFPGVLHHGKAGWGLDQVGAAAVCHSAVGQPSAAPGGSADGTLPKRGGHGPYPFRWCHQFFIKTVSDEQDMLNNNSD